MLVLKKIWQLYEIMKTNFGSCVLKDNDEICSQVTVTSVEGLTAPATREETESLSLSSPDFYSSAITGFNFLRQILLPLNYKAT